MRKRGIHIGNALAENGKFDDAVARRGASPCGSSLPMRSAQQPGECPPAAKQARLAACQPPAGSKSDPITLNSPSNMGAALEAQGRTDEACRHRRALALKPDYAEGHYNLANALAGENNSTTGGRRISPSAGDQAELCRCAAQPRQCPQGARAARGRDRCLRRAIELRPNYWAAYNNLAVVLREQGRLDEAVVCCQRAHPANPNHAEAHNTLGKTR